MTDTNENKTGKDTGAETSTDTGDIRRVNDAFEARMSQNERHIQAMQKKAVLTAVLSSICVIGTIGLVSYFILGPTILEDLDRQDKENAVFILENLEKIKTKQEELSVAQENMKKEMRSFVAMDLSEQIKQIQNLNAQVKMVNDRIASLQTTSTGQKIFGDSIEDLQSTILGMKGRVDTLEEELEEAKKDNDALADMLQGVTGKELKAAAMLLAVSQLRSSLNQEQSFDKDLATVQTLMGDDEESLAALKKLEPYARSGVLTKQGLQTEFKGLAGDIVMAELAGEEVSWKEKAANRLGNIVSVRKTGELEGQDTQAVVARAERMIDEGNFQGAIAELEKLDGKPREKAQSWIDDAQARLIADNVSSMMTQNVIKGLSVDGLKNSASGITNFIQNNMGDIGGGLKGDVQPYQSPSQGGSQGFGQGFGQ